jgi:hypothetical protein
LPPSGNRMDAMSPAVKRQVVTVNALTFMRSCLRAQLRQPVLDLYCVYHVFSY